MVERSFSFFIITVAESSQSEPVGLLGGTTYQMGNFEECIKTKGYGIRGKYCLANFKYSLNPEDLRKYSSMVLPTDFRDVNHEASVWEALIRVCIYADT